MGLTDRTPTGRPIYLKPKTLRSIGCSLYVFCSVDPKFLHGDVCVGPHHIITRFKLSHMDIHGCFGFHLQTLMLDVKFVDFCRMRFNDVRLWLDLTYVQCLLPSAASHGGHCDAGCCIVTPYGSKIYGSMSVEFWGWGLFLFIVALHSTVVLFVVHVLNELVAWILVYRALLNSTRIIVGWQLRLGRIEIDDGGGVGWTNYSKKLR